MANINQAEFWSNLFKKLAKIFLEGIGGKKRRRKRKTKNQHVVPHEEGWAVKGEGNKRYTAVYDYQDDAIARATRIAKKHNSDVIIHRKTGGIRDRRSY